MKVTLTEMKELKDELENEIGMGATFEMTGVTSSKNPPPPIAVEAWMGFGV